MASPFPFPLGTLKDDGEMFKVSPSHYKMLKDD